MKASKLPPLIPRPAPAFAPPLEPNHPVPDMDPIALQYRLNLEAMMRFFRAAPKDGIRLEHTDQMEQVMRYSGLAMELAMHGKQWKPQS